MLNLSSLLHRAALCVLALVLAALACTGDDGTLEPPPPAFGDVEVTVVTTGEEPDPEGYLLTVAGESRGVEIDETVVFADVPVGSVEAELSDYAFNCGVPDNPRSLEVAAGQTSETTFEVACPRPRLAFSSDRSGARHVWITDSAGEELVMLTEGFSSARSPSWSPDGARIAFSGAEEESSGIFVMDADGSDLVHLQDDAGSPVWSPDGSRIAFTSSRDGHTDIFVMNADGSDPVNLTNSPALDAGPAWSPDGARIAFWSDRDELNDDDIYVMEADGSNVVNLTETGGVYWQPAWSPDGSRIAFSTEAGRGRGFFDIYVMDADGSNRERLTDFPYPGPRAFTPAWSPDGSRISFQSDEREDSYIAGPDDIFIMNADGSDLVNVTQHEASDREASWRPAVPPLE